MNMALVIHPGNTENNLTLRLNDAVKNTGSHPFRMLYGNRLKAFQYFLDCLVKLRFMLIAIDDPIIDWLKNLHAIASCYLLSGRPLIRSDRLVHTYTY